MTSPALFGWQIILATVVAATFGPATLVNVTFGLFLPELQSEFGWTRSEISLSLTIFIMVLVARLPSMGRIIDVVGARRSALVSIPAYAVALMGLGFLNGSLTTLYILFGLVAALSVGAQSLTLIKIISNWFDQRRGLAIGLCMAGNGVGYVLTPMFTRILIDDMGWRFAYVGLGALALFVAFPAMFFLVRDTPQERGQTVDGCTSRPGTPSPVDTGLSLGEAARTRAFWLLALGHAFALLVVTAVNVHAITHMKESLGYTLAEASWIIMLMTFFQVGGVLVGWWIGDRFDKPRLSALCMVLHAAGLLALYWGTPLTAAYVGLL